MKKLISLLLILSVLLGLIACGGSPVESEDEIVDAVETEQSFEEDEDAPYYSSGSPLASVSINKDAAFVLDDNQSIKVDVSSAQSGVGIYDVIEMFMTPRNIGKICAS